MIHPSFTRVASWPEAYLHPGMELGRSFQNNPRFRVCRVIAWRSELDYIHHTQNRPETLIGIFDMAGVERYGKRVVTSRLDQPLVYVTTDGPHALKVASSMYAAAGND